MQAAPRIIPAKLVLFVVLAICLSVVLAAAAVARAASLPGVAVPLVASQTPPFHQQNQTPIAAAGYQQGENCDNPAGTDLWHFVLPGRTATFVSLVATFTYNGAPLVVTFPGPNATSVQSGKGVNIVTPAGALLTGATAVTTAPVDFFNLSHTCSGTPQPSPSPSPSPSASPSPLPSPTPPLPSPSNS